MSQRVTVAVVMGVLVAGVLEGGSPLGSYQAARQVLDAGIKAAGGLEALREIKDVSREATGTAYAQGQSLQPDEPLLARAIELQLFQDFAGGRSATLFDETGAGVLPTKTRTVAIENGFSYNLMSKVSTPMTAGALTASRDGLRRDPVVLLLTALDRAETLRCLGDDTIDGKRHQLVTFSTADGAQVALAFDAATGPALARADARRQRRARRRAHRDAAVRLPGGRRRREARQAAEPRGDPRRRRDHPGAEVRQGRRERRPRERAARPAERRRDGAGGAAGAAASRSPSWATTPTSRPAARTTACSWSSATTWSCSRRRSTRSARSRCSRRSRRRRPASRCATWCRPTTTSTTPAACAPTSPRASRS